MNELIERLQKEAGLSPEQATRAIATIKAYIQDQLPPMMKGVVDQFLSANQPEDEPDRGI